MRSGRAFRRRSGLGGVVAVGGVFGRGLEDDRPEVGGDGAVEPAGRRSSSATPTPAADFAENAEGGGLCSSPVPRHRIELTGPDGEKREWTAEIAGTLVEREKACHAVARDVERAVLEASPQSGQLS